MRIPKTVKYLPTEKYLELFLQLIRDSSKGRRIQKNGKQIRSATIDNYTYTYKLLQSYVAETGQELRLYVVPHLKASELEQARKYYKKFFLTFCDYLYFKKDFTTTMWV